MQALPYLIIHFSTLLRIGETFLDTNLTPNHITHEAFMDFYLYLKLPFSPIMLKVGFPFPLLNVDRHV